MLELKWLELNAFIFNSLTGYLKMFYFLLLLGFHHFSFLVGAAGGATVMMILCGFLLCARYVHTT